MAEISGGIKGEAGNVYEQAFLHGMVGGTAEVISGGNFANGAMTNAIQWAFNAEGEELSPRQHCQFGGVQCTKVSNGNWVPTNVAAEVEAALAKNLTMSDPSLTPQGTGGVSGAYHVFLFGQYAETGVITNGGRMCYVNMACNRFGPGVLGEVGFVFGLSLVSAPLQEGTHKVEGLFIDGGIKTTFGYQYLWSDSGISGSRGGGGPGAGVAIGYMQCKVVVSICTGD